MARKRKKGGGHAPNHERWIVSYADFVTLLFAFFVVMFATANEKGKNRAVADSVKQALEEGQISHVGAAIKQVFTEKTPPKKPLPAPKAKEKENPQQAIEAKKTCAAPNPELRPVMERLSKQLEASIRRGDVEIHMEARGLAISFRQVALFASGDDHLKSSAHEPLSKVADAVRGIPNQVRLEGNTDNVPIHNNRFRSNWELSAARSISVLSLFADDFQVPTERLGIAGYANVAPVASNDTEEGRARNRRVDVVILSDKGGLTEPPSKQAQAAMPKQAQAPMPKQAQAPPPKPAPSPPPGQKVAAAR